MMPPEQTIITQEQSKKILVDVIICSASLAAFAYLISCYFPLKAAAFIPLIIVAFIISQNISWSFNSARLLFKHRFSLHMLAFYIIGFQMGIAGAIYYRGSFGMPALPTTIKSFAFVAVGIGITEELVFRGFIQGRLSKLHPGFAIVFAALAHATYKACLFLSPAVTYHYSIVLFYTWSLAAFILMGLLRYYSKSIVPAIIVHAVFDYIVYAESTTAPWWVW